MANRLVEGIPRRFLPQYQSVEEQERHFPV